MKKIIMLSMAFITIALLPQTVSAQTEATPTKPVVKEQKVMKEAKPAIEQKVLFHKKKNVVPAKKLKRRKR